MNGRLLVRYHADPLVRTPTALLSAHVNSRHDLHAGYAVITGREQASASS